jgi:PIN domain nuclease of toxin-antitoxin system
VRFVVDTSAVLAVVRGEPGAAEAERLMTGGLIGTANLVEVVSKGAQYGFPQAETLRAVSILGLDIVDVDRATADQAMALWRLRKHNVSLGDRLCIGLARARGMPVLTGERVWKALDLGVEVFLFR